MSVQAGVFGMKGHRVAVDIDGFSELTEVGGTSSHPNQSVRVFGVVGEYVFGLGIARQIDLVLGVGQHHREERVAEEGDGLGEWGHVHSGA